MLIGSPAGFAATAGSRLFTVAAATVARRTANCRPGDAFGWSISAESDLASAITISII
ncbi:hypothetical protein ACFSKM_01315 [Ancylobacter dichloromethanicus]